MPLSTFVVLSTPKEYNPSSDFTLGKKRKREEEEVDSVEVNGNNSVSIVTIV